MLTHLGSRLLRAKACLILMVELPHTVTYYPQCLLDVGQMGSRELSNGHNLESDFLEIRNSTIIIRTATKYIFVICYICELI